MSDLSVDYAKSNRSKCKACKGVIEQSSLRIGKDRDFGDYTQTAWYHPACFPSSNALRSLAVTSVPGFKDLKRKDQQGVRKLIAALSAEAEEKAAKKGNPAKTLKSKRTKKQVEERFKGYTKTQLEELKTHQASLADMATEELKSLCRKNDQKVTGTKGELIDRVADGRVLGRIPKCSSCGGGHLRFNAKTGAYSCPGYMEDSDFIRCNKTFTSSEVTRLPWED